MNELEIKTNAAAAQATQLETAVESTTSTKRTRVARQAPNHPVEAQQERSNIPTFIDPREARKREAKERWMKDKERKSKMVTGKFLFNECPGGELKFSYVEFPGDRRKEYALKHDQIYTIPLGVAMHLNDNCSYPEFSHNLDAGKAIDSRNMYVQSNIHRTNFIPMDWSVDVGNFTGNSIAQVTYTNPMDNRYNLDANGR